MRCVHCLGSISEVTRDHWLPTSWYPSSTEAELERWTFPSCVECNRRYGQIEDRLRSRLALALDPTAPAAQGIVDSVHRGMSPGRGRNDRDRAARAARRTQIMEDMLAAHEVPAHAVLPGLGRWQGLQVTLSPPYTSLLSGRD